MSEIEDNFSGGRVENEVYDGVRHDWSGVEILGFTLNAYG